VTLIHTDSVDERWQETADFVDRTMAAAVDEFGRKLA
jgi:hypothetical protein